MGLVLEFLGTCKTKVYIDFSYSRVLISDILTFYSAEVSVSHNFTACFQFVLRVSVFLHYYFKSSFSSNADDDTSVN